ncbi:MAG: SRPBCC domain-containing protein [Chloroflexota bacterium]|nr:SRPBCC domain-containing protein [Chloroflexota bacterium]
MDLRTRRTISSAIEIHAPIEVAWAVLTDFHSYPDWNPVVRRLRGRPRIGRRITILSKPPGARAIAFAPVVLAWSPPRELRWRSTFISPRLFAGEHGFRFERLDDERVRFVQDETISGLLVPLYSRLRLTATRLGFDELNHRLRERAERAARDEP